MGHRAFITARIIPGNRVLEDAPAGFDHTTRRRVLRIARHEKSIDPKRRGSLHRASEKAFPMPQVPAGRTNGEPDVSAKSPQVVVQAMPQVDDTENPALVEEK